MRAFLGWLRRKNCSMAAIQKLEEGASGARTAYDSPLVGDKTQLKAICPLDIRSFQLGLRNGQQAHGHPHRGVNAAAGQQLRRARPLA
ncbi:hypothetical protein [Mesorhizobium sp. M0701]|uniref:hypothetical protein n=1 Tax=Mesorhizobium sp. M0701 TaxID=2956989 RepID=UPI003336CBFE